MPQLEHITEEGAVGLGVLAIDDGMRTNNHSKCLSVRECCIQSRAIISRAGSGLALTGVSLRKRGLVTAEGWGGRGQPSREAHSEMGK